MKCLRIFYCIIMAGLLMQVMADDNTGSTISSEISTSSREVGKSDRLENFDELFDVNGDLNKDESNEAPKNGQVEDNEAPTTYRGWSDKFADGDDFEGAFEQLPDHEINELKEHVKRYKKIIGIYENLIEYRGKMIDDLNEKIKVLELDRTELINLKNKLDAAGHADHAEPTPTMIYYSHNGHKKVANVREYLSETMASKKSELAQELIEQIKFLKPFAMISAAMIAGASLVCIAKKGVNWYRHYCAKRRQRAQTTVTMQEITIFEIR